jgi:sugar-specific transcriptional regulator TrmB
MTEREPDVVDALERLGLSGYEARTFVALHRLGGGTASEVHRASTVPQSRVYGVAEELQERGLVEIQASTPKRYRPVPLETARGILRAELDDAEERAFEYLERVRGEAAEERGDAVWMLRGAGTVTGRAVELIEGAEQRVLFGAARPAQVPPAVGEALADRAAAGVEVIGLGDAATAERYPDAVAVVDTSSGTPAPANAARVLLVDGDGILMSTVETDPADGEVEVGMWTAGTGLGRMLVGIVGGAISGGADLPPSDG